MFSVFCSFTVSKIILLYVGYAIFYILQCICLPELFCCSVACLLMLLQWASHILRKTLVSWQYGAMDTLENMRVFALTWVVFPVSQATIIITCFGLMD